MADVQHAALTGADLHEPKGAASAASNRVYVASGAGSGTWSDLYTLGPTAIHAESYMNGNATQTVINTTDVYEAVAGTKSNGTVNGITCTNGVMTVLTAGIYKFEASISLTAAANNQTVQFDFGIDTGSGFVAHNQGPPRRLIATGSDVGAISTQAIIQLAVGDKVRIQVRNRTSNANVTITEINACATMLKAV